MSSANWQKLEQLFNHAVDLSFAERAEFLAGIECKDPVLAAELRELLAAEPGATLAVDRAVGKALVSYTKEERALPFETLGPYRILGEIGRGGMGAVYLAERRQDYWQQVAIKVVKRGMDSDFILDRFRHERQILASLNHPYIAKMFDGGLTPDNRPYLVMEYVEGVKVTRYFKNLGINPRVRIELFRKICDAVQYAHQNLVIHRDLKPGNILIANDGTPKLLDFGLAKLIAPDMSTDQTLLGIGGLMFTPGYASPEQAAGQPVSTATDTFALGAILFELLTGRQIRNVDSQDMLSVSRAIQEQEIPRARTVAPNLDRDLDNILAKALQQEPERRYGSAEQLNEDLRRYLVGLPVLAVPDAFSYRAEKYVSRNRLQITGAALFVGALAAGLATTTWQAHRAEEQSQIARAERAKSEVQRQIAIAERERAEASAVIAKAAQNRAETLATETEKQRVTAERRFAQVRQMAGTFLFDFHKAIADLPGSLPARKLVVEKGLQYLDGLSADAGRDASFQLELARAYLQIGDIQGEPALANLGDIEGAIKSYEKGLRIIRAAISRRPDDALLRAEFNLTERLARGYIANKRTAESVAIIPIAVSKARALYASRPNKENLFSLGMLEAANGMVETQIAHPDVALRFFEAAVEKYRLLVAAQPTNEEMQSRLSAALGGASDAAAQTGQLNSAVAMAREQSGIIGKIAEHTPNNGRMLRQLARSHTRVGDYLGNNSGPNLGDPQGASVEYRAALEIFAKLAYADPANATAQGDLANAHRRMGDFYRSIQRNKEAIVEFRIYSEKYRELLAKSPRNSLHKRLVADSYSRLGNTYLEILNYDEAIRYAQQSIRLLEELSAAEPGLAVVRILQFYPTRDLARSYLALRRYSDALAAFDRGVEICEDSVRRAPNSVIYKMANAEALNVRANARALVAKTPRGGEEAVLQAGARQDYDRAGRILEALDREKQLPESEKKTTVVELARDREAFEKDLAAAKR